MSVLGTVAAAATFFFTGSPQAALLAYSIGSGVDAYVNAPDRTGPRLDDLKNQLSTYGAPIPFEWGCNRHAGSIIWPRVLEAVEHEHTESAKGGPDSTTYTYTLSCAVLVCEGPITGIRRIWANKKIIYDNSIDNDGEISDPGLNGIRFYLGTEAQEADPLIEAADGPSPAYRGYAYVVFENYDVTEMQGRPPQFEFEVITAASSEIPPPSTFGDSFDEGVGSVAFKSTLDPETGYLWVATMTGHYQLIGSEFQLNGLHKVPQVQIYDTVDGSLVAIMEPPVCSEQWDPDEPPHEVYPFNGEIVYSGGKVFAGRNTAGWPSGTEDARSYAHGTVFDTASFSHEYLVSDCSHKQFQNAAFWPGCPVPVMDNNKVYFASSGGLFSTIAVAFYGRGHGGDPYATPPYEAAWPVPDRTGAFPKWTIFTGWKQNRPNGFCSIGPDFTNISPPLSDWAFRTTVIDDEHATIVQGYEGDILNGGSYVSWVIGSPAITDGTSDSLDPANALPPAYLPGSHTTMPPIVWDPLRRKLWAFAGSSDHCKQLYSFESNGVTLDRTGHAFIFPTVSGESFGDDVKAMVFDEATGYLRLLLGGGSTDTPHLVLFDPENEVVVSSMDVDITVRQTAGRMWDLPDQQKVVYSDGYDLIFIPYGSPLDPEQVPLSSIVRDICLRAGLTEDDIDVSDLTDVVDGYIVGRQTTARAAIEPLQTAFYFDAVEDDDKIVFVKRDGTTVTTIPEADRAAHENGQDAPSALSIRRDFELETPFQCEVEYVDIDADHLIGTQYDRRLTKQSRQKMNLALPIVMTAEKAKQIARTTLYQAWQNMSFSWTTSRKYAFLKPTDLVALPTASAAYQARITNKREQPNGVIEWEARITALDVYTQSGADATPTGFESQTIYDPGQTLLALMDIPMLRDDDNNSGFYVAMGGERDGWRGAQLFRSMDGGVNYDPLFGVATEAAIGLAQGVLGDFTEGNIFDEGNSVQIYMASKLPLTAVTQDQVLNGSNMAVLGAHGRWEVIYFKNAVLTAPNTYVLSGLLRGCRGTEWATGLHEVGDMFVLASLAAWNRLTAGDTGLPRKYKAPPNRVRLDAVTDSDFTNSSVGLKPFAPVDLLGERDGSNNLTLTWSWRTRLASGTLYMPTLLGESTEAYEVDIVLADVVVRTISATAATAEYTAADQTVDGITPGDDVTVRIYQLSASVGRGYPLEETL